MEYQGQSWLDPSLKCVYNVVPNQPKSIRSALCAVWAPIVIKTQYRGTTYYFCSEDHKHQFDAAPSKITTQGNVGCGRPTSLGGDCHHVCRHYFCDDCLNFLNFLTSIF